MASSSSWGRAVKKTRMGRVGVMSFCCRMVNWVIIKDCAHLSYIVHVGCSFSWCVLLLACSRRVREEKGGGEDKTPNHSGHTRRRVAACSGKLASPYPHVRPCVWHFYHRMEGDRWWLPPPSKIARLIGIWEPLRAQVMESFIMSMTIQMSHTHEKSPQTASSALSSLTVRAFRRNRKEGWWVRLLWGCQIMIEINWCWRFLEIVRFRIWPSVGDSSLLYSYLISCYFGGL